MNFSKKLLLSTLLIFTLNISSIGTVHRSYATELSSELRLTATNSISEFDQMAERLCQKTQWDWRLVVAIASAESTFSTTAKSHRGATGLMQIMPRTAKYLGFQDANLTDPETSISIALTLLDKINSSFRFPDGISERERLSVVLAAYNAGIGYVIKARKAAYEAGAAYNQWSSLKSYITRNNTHSETVAYVDKVLSKYNRYKNI